MNPRFPAACNGRIITCTAIVEAMFGALASADPSLARAASGMIHIFTLGGTNDNGQWGFLRIAWGGSGAQSGVDGVNAMSVAMPGGSAGARSSVGYVGADVEPLEARYPVLVERMGLLEDSGGPGMWRGGVRGGHAPQGAGGCTGDRANGSGSAAPAGAWLAASQGGRAATSCTVPAVGTAGFRQGDERHSGPG